MAGTSNLWRRLTCYSLHLHQPILQLPPSLPKISTPLVSIAIRKTLNRHIIHVRQASSRLPNPCFDINAIKLHITPQFIPPVPQFLPEVLLCDQELGTHLEEVTRKPTVNISNLRSGSHALCLNLIPESRFLSGEK